MSSTARSILIALIGALATIIAAIILASAAAASRTENTINRAGGDLKVLQDDIAKLKIDIARAQTSISGAVQSFPQSLSKANVGSIRTFADEYHGKSTSPRELLNISGKGALISGAVLGFYFKDAPGGANYVVQIDVDGIPFKYPSVSQRAYTQGQDGANSGVLVLPQIRYSQSLRITYWYPGGNRYISAYAIVLPE
jgi:hypothetical protein